MNIKVENREMQQFKASLFYSGILTLVVVILWVGLSVYTRFTKVEDDPGMEKLVEPIRPNLDIESMKVFSDGRIMLPEQFTITAIKTDGKTKSVVTINPFDDSVIE